MSDFAMYPSLRNRTVLITGGGSGIGAAFVEQFALQGAKVVFMDIAEEPSLKLLDSLEGRTPHAPSFTHCDITDTTALRSAIETLSDTTGPIRVLINNAGSDDRHNFTEVTPAYWDQRISVNLKHQFFAAQAVVPGMKSSGGGSIVNMSSIAWMIPTPNLSVYETAKAAIVGMTRSMAHELGIAKIRVNCVSPGAILTERQRRLWMSPEYEQEVLSRQCIKSHILPEDVARLVLFLAADDSAAITNQNYIVDGGWI
jgi:NAD(P)-dependent dehydrogenase (short-subunit alcohol dehydrogenase family)